jgi:hypothetical protein
MPGKFRRGRGRGSETVETVDIHSMAYRPSPTEVGGWSLDVLPGQTADFVSHFVIHFVARCLKSRHHGADPA